MSESHYGEHPDDFSEAESIAEEMPGFVPLADDSFETYALAQSALEWKAERDAALARAEAAEKSEKMVTDFSAATDEILLRTTRQRDALVTERDALRKQNTKLYTAYEAAMDRVAAEETQPQTDVDKVIDQLDKRIIGTPERTKLRGALDRADAPDKSRAGQDAAVGKALRL